MPKVSILLPAHNAEKTLAETLRSLANQTFKDFEVLLVNDASTDSTLQVAQQMAAGTNVRILDLSENNGVAGALRRGLEIIDSKYVARLDADDIAHPQRLELQVRALEESDSMDVCGSNIGFFVGDFVEGSQIWILAHPTRNSQIKTALIQYCSVVHGSAIFRREFFEDIGGYRDTYDYAEDYDLWCRGALLGKRYMNIPETLTFVRRHDGQVSRQKAALQYQRDLMVKKYYISALLGDEPAELLPEFFSLQTSYSSLDVAIKVVHTCIPKLLKLGLNIPDKETFAKLVSECFDRHIGKPYSEAK